MKGHNWGNCKKCDKFHGEHPRGMKGKTHSEKLKKKWSKERVGSKASNWKGGRILIGGYVYIHTPKHPHATKDGYVCEHRLVLEKHLGRLLTPKEIIHHKDGNKNNNNIENLKIYPNTGLHTIKNHCIRDKNGRFKNQDKKST